MRSRALFAIVVLSCALVSGGWFVERGLLGKTTASPVNGGRLFDQVFERVAHAYVDTLADSALYSKAIDGLVSELGDPHSAYLSPKLVANLSERTSGRYGGIGAQIDIRDGWITIVAPLPGGPAVDAGIRAGDRIVDVNGVELRGVTVEAAQKALRGPAGSVVKLTMERPGVATPLKFALTRKEVRVRPVSHALLLGDGVGYVSLAIFSQEAAGDLRRAIDSLRAAGMRTLVFDMRGDPGGLLDEGVAVSDLFLNPGQGIVSMKGRTSDASRSYADHAPQPWPDLPVAVLVDSNTASAAEIVAGALQDHDRALLLGTTTYGKGSAQTVFPLGSSGGGALKLTIALWYTPSGRSINRPRAGGGTDGDGALPDSTPRPKYKTDDGRSVLGGGGITPDIQIAIDRSRAGGAADSAFDQALGKHITEFRDALTDYARTLEATRAVASPNFVVTPEMRGELWKRMKARGVVMDSTTYTAASSLIDRVMGYEIARYVFGPDAEFQRRLRDDSTLSRAVAIVRGATTPRELLQRAANQTPAKRS
jgi:carboxyl-terminal processing protease